MSQLSQIKGQISQVATNVEQTAGALNSFAQNLQTHISVISSAIGGTSSNEDKEMVAALQEGQRAVREAAVQLFQAAQKAKDWVSKA